MFQFLLVIGLIALDQLSKYLAKVYLLPLGYDGVPIINGVFHLSYTENSGAAFSILQNQRWLLVVLSIVFSIFAIYYLIKHKNEKFMLRLGISIVLAGAVGNLIDRIRTGLVIDFMDFRLINFAVFNIADSCIVVGCILLAFYYLFMMDKEKNELN